MIRFSFKKLPVDEDGKAYASLDEFQAAMLMRLLEAKGDALEELFETIVARKSEVMEILELTMDARPTSRGQKRPRKAKTLTYEQAMAKTEPESPT